MYVSLLCTSLLQSAICMLSRIVKMVNDAGRLFAKVMNWSLPADRLSLMRGLLALTYEASGAPVMRMRSSPAFLVKVLMKVLV